MAKPGLRAVPDPASSYPDDAIPMHPLFAHSKSVEPLPYPIEAIDVCRLKNGKSRMLRWLPADDLPDEIALLEQFGDGDYELIGRDASRARILRRVFLSVGEGGGSDDDEREAPRQVVVQQPNNQLTEVFGLLFQEMSRSREREAAAQERMLSAVTESSKTVVQAITTLASARLADQKEIVAAIASREPQSDFNAEKMAEAFAQGMAVGEERSAGNQDFDGLAKIAAAVVEGAKLAKDQ